MNTAPWRKSNHQDTQNLYAVTTNRRSKVNRGDTVLTLFRLASVKGNQKSSDLGFGGLAGGDKQRNHQNTKKKMMKKGSRISRDYGE